MPTKKAHRLMTIGGARGAFFKKIWPRARGAS